ncbi:MAG TPA: hypothetical protein VJ550_15240 [Geomonas sp.]|nr:hypothetical protein [Geomonas sp.]
MKKIICSAVSVLAALSFAAVASAIPVNGNMNSAINVLENQDQGTKPPKKPVTHKKSHKQQKAKVKKASPASTGTPASSPKPEGK